MLKQVQKMKDITHCKSHHGPHVQLSYIWHLFLHTKTIKKKINMPGEHTLWVYLKNSEWCRFLKGLRATKKRTTQVSRNLAPGEKTGHNFPIAHGHSSSGVRVGMGPAKGSSTVASPRQLSGPNQGVATVAPLLSTCRCWKGLDPQECPGQKPCEAPQSRMKRQVPWWTEEHTGK